MTSPFTVQKYRDQWIFRSPFTGEIIAEGETGNAIYLVKRLNDAYIDGETVGNITVTGATTEDPVPALAVGHTRPRMVEDDTLPDIELSGYWMVIISDTDYSRGHAHITHRAHTDTSSAFDIKTATPETVEAARLAALASVPAGEDISSTRLVVGPTDQIKKAHSND
nr:MAG TPA: hypothetical protein [Caudoviricetes sp.]